MFSTSLFPETELSFTKAAFTKRDMEEVSPGKPKPPIPLEYKSN